MGLSLIGVRAGALTNRMAFAALGNRFAMGAVHCGMIDTMVRRIQDEFNIPPQNWRWSPRDWSGGQQDSSALNYQAGMRSRNPRLPLLPKTHPEGAAWAAEGKDRKSYRAIIDQQRSFVGRPHRSRSGNTMDLASLADLAGLVAAPSQTSGVSATDPLSQATMGPVPHLYDPYSYAAMSIPASDAGWPGPMPTLASVAPSDGMTVLDMHGRDVRGQDGQGGMGQSGMHPNGQGQYEGPVA